LTITTAPFRHEQIVLPAIVPGTGEPSLEWKLPVYHTLHHILTNPVYAGAYVFGRRAARVTIEAGRKRVIRSLRRNWSDWEILIKDHHEGYESAADCGQCQRDELFGAGLCPSGWSALAGPVLVPDEVRSI
jgi:hypothetical protein